MPDLQAKGNGDNQRLLITFTAAILPWLPALCLVVWAIAAIWRAWRRRRHRT